MNGKKHFVKQLLSTSLITTTILAGSHSSSAAFCDYNDDASVVGGAIVCEGLDIRGTSKTVFQGTVTNSELMIDIFDSAKPVFDNDVISDTKIRVQGTAQPIFNGNVQTGKGLRIESGTPIFNGNVQVAENLRMSSVSNPFFNGNVQVNGEIQIFVSAQPVFSGDVTANEMQFLDIDENAKATFTDGATLDAPVTTEQFGTGSLIFEGDTTIHQSIGTARSPLNKVTFSSNDPIKTATLRSDIYSREIYLGGSNINVDNNIRLVSTDSETIHLSNTIFTLNSNTLFHSGNVKNDVAGKITINTLLSLSGEDKIIGHFEQPSGKFDMVTNVNGITINLTEAQVPLPLEGEPENYDLFVEEVEGGTFTLSDNGNVTLNPPQNRFVVWSHADGILTRTLVDNPEEVLEEETDNNENLPLITPELITELTNIAASDGGEAASNALDRLANADALALATTPVGRAYENATQSISDRAGGFVALPIVIDEASAGISGVTAGDTALRHGSWVSPFYGHTIQRVRGTTPGYRAGYYGAVIGADTLLNDNITVGIAFSAIKTDVKHKHLNTGDKTKANTYVGSLYGVYQISDKWFVQGVASISRSKIRNREIRREFARTAIASANYTADAWGSEILVGYNHKIGRGVLLTPTFGFEYNRMNSIKYKETGTVNQNLLVKRQVVDRIEAILGAKISGAYAYNDWLFVPEVHGNVRYDVKGKSLKVDIRQEGSTGPSLIPRTSKVSRTIVNLGVGVNTKSNDMMEYGISYDVRLANKYVGQQGTLKIKMNF